MSAPYEWTNSNNSHIVEGGEVWRLESGGVGVNIFLPLDAGYRGQGCDQMLSRGGDEYKSQYSRWPATWEMGHGFFVKKYIFYNNS